MLSIIILLILITILLLMFIVTKILMFMRASGSLSLQALRPELLEGARDAAAAGPVSSNV